RDALGESWIPAPVSSSRSAASKSTTRKLCFASASAAVSPPMPAPATTTVREEATAHVSIATRVSGGWLWRERALRRSRRMGIKARVVAKQRRAIGTDDLGGVAHVEKHVRVVEGRQFAHAHELLGADFDHRHARSVMEVGNDVLRHGSLCLTGAACRDWAQPLNYRRFRARRAP